MLLSVPSTVIFPIVGILIYVISFFISHVKFKEDLSFHRWVYGICVSVVLLFSILTLLKW